MTVSSGSNLSVLNAFTQCVRYSKFISQGSKRRIVLQSSMDMYTTNTLVKITFTGLLVTKDMAFLSPLETKQPHLPELQ